MCFCSYRQFQVSFLEHSNSNHLSLFEIKDKLFSGQLEVDYQKRETKIAIKNETNKRNAKITYPKIGVLYYLRADVCLFRTTF